MGGGGQSDGQEDLINKYLTTLAIHPDSCSVSTLIFSRFTSSRKTQYNEVSCSFTLEHVHVCTCARVVTEDRRAQADFQPHSAPAVLDKLQQDKNHSVATFVLFSSFLFIRLCRIYNKP